MGERTSGLRFDIYERVQLPLNQPAIGELEEIELSPEISVSSKDTTTLLQGNLRLTGRYSGEGGERAEHTLEHLIPVEISLPAGRIRNLRDIDAGIENFDVDVISPRSLNVTGVLSLSGISLPSAQMQGWPEEDEEVAFVHHVEQAEEPQVRQNEPTARRDDTQPQRKEKRESAGSERKGLSEGETASSGGQEAGSRKQGSASQEIDARERPKQESQSAQAAPEQSQAADSAAEQQESPVQSAQHQEPAGEVGAAASAAQPETDWIESREAAEMKEPGKEAQSKDAFEAPEAPKEVKIAFAGKKEEPQTMQGAELRDAVHTPKTPASASGSRAGIQEDAAQEGADGISAESGQISDDAARSAGVDSLEWKKLFLSGDAEESFSKMRMCIVQKEETLDLIAERYGMNPREIQLYNRLGELDVSEGQIIYIPSTRIASE